MKVGGAVERIQERVEEMIRVEVEIIHPSGIAKITKEDMTDISVLTWPDIDQIMMIITVEQEVPVQVLMVGSRIPHFMKHIFMPWARSAASVTPDTSVIWEAIENVGNE